MLNQVKLILQQKAINKGENEKKKIGYFFKERCGWTKIKISQVNKKAISMEAIKYCVSIKISFLPVKPAQTQSQDSHTNLDFEFIILHCGKIGKKKAFMI